MSPTPYDRSAEWDFQTILCTMRDCIASTASGQSHGLAEIFWMAGGWLLLDHACRSHHDRLRNRDSEGLGGFQVDHERERHWPFHRNITGLGAF